MARGLTKREFYNRVYSRLKTIQRQLKTDGIETVYHNCQLCYQEPVENSPSGGFNIGFNRLQASNGETAGLPYVYISVVGLEVKRYDHLEFNRGIERIKEIFAPPRMDARIEYHGSLFLVRPLTDECAMWLVEHTGDDARFMGRALAVEPRFIEGFVEAMRADGGFNV